MTLLRRRRGQATTETVLLLPIFMLFLYIFVKRHNDSSLFRQKG